ncbi:MAG: L,D-transpeptidase family protein [Lachnospiraceae bacterium]
MKASRFWTPKNAAVFILAALAAVYVLIGSLYSDTFYPGTFVNDIYSTGKTIVEMNKELKRTQTTEIFVVVVEDREYEIKLQDIGYLTDYSKELLKIKEKQTSLFWAEGLFRQSRYFIEPKITFSKEALQQVCDASGIFQDFVKEPVVEIRKGEAYELYDGMQHTLSVEKTMEKISDSLSKGEFCIDVSDCFENLEYTAAMERNLIMWEKVKMFQNCGVTYDMGDEKIELTPEITSGFLKVNDKGEFVGDGTGYLAPDEEAIDAFVNSLCERYDTFGKPHTFKTTAGDVIEIEGGTYGNKLDYEAEKAYLLNLFTGENQRKDTKENHIPAYEQEAYVRGYDDIGDTYVEVDMGAQKLYYYEEGELLIETDVVTGNLRNKCDTPTGVNYVYFMQRNRTLRGPNYATPVSYWMAVNGHIGLHDANWRKEFGGEIYKTNGSHGCVNIPKKTAGELYELLTVGVPVVMFY